MAREKDYILIMSGDIKAQNTLFGSNITNKHGKHIEDLLVEFDLAISNRGSKSHVPQETPAQLLISKWVYDCEPVLHTGVTAK